MDRKKKVIQGFILFFLFALLLLSIQIFHYGSLTGFVVSTEELVKVDLELIETLNEKDEVEVIIGVERGVEEKDLFVDTKQNLSSGDFVADISKRELISLIHQDEVKYIEPVREFEIALQDTVNIVNANSTWSLQESGFNFTGIGETICIIDTGVDYSHIDLIGKNKTSCNMNCIDQVCVEDCNITDLNGHGTHVAGVIVASGGILGISKEANFIGMKVFPGSSGSGATTTGINNAIDWCVNNSVTHNISVISMSLGSVSVYEGDCDNIFPSFSNSISGAATKNISVVVSSGNAGGGVRNTTSISSPACINNATAVSATDKNDSISNYGHYSSNVKLFAPGTSINSTCIPNSYCSKTGTSMSAPVVSGAISIINQFLRISGQNKDVKGIESVLHSSGKVINDGVSNFSRINLYDSILSVDNIKPNVSLSLPINGEINISQTQTFSCDFNDWQLQNSTLYLWYENGSLFTKSSVKSFGERNSSNFSISNLEFNNYLWNCLVGDSVGNENFASNNFSLTIGGVSSYLSLPLNNNITNKTEINYACRIQSEKNKKISNVTFFLWNSSDIVNTSFTDISDFNVVDYNYSYNYSFSLEGEYKWNCLVYNNASNFSFAGKNFSIRYDATNPSISLLSPENESSYNSNSLDLNFVFSVSDDSPVSCDLVINDKIVNNFNISNSSTYNFVRTFTPSNYTWRIDCTDKAGNLNFLGERVFSVNIEESTSESGGSSGSSKTEKEEKIVEPVEQTSEEVVFVITNETEEVVSEEVLESPIESSGITGRAVDGIFDNPALSSIGLFFLITALIFIGAYLVLKKRKSFSKKKVEVFHNLK